jgi:hypothetical protein
MEERLAQARAEAVSGYGSHSARSIARTGGTSMRLGGKGRLRARIIPLLPKTQVYVEPYGGAPAVSARAYLSGSGGGGATALRRPVSDRRWSTLKTSNPRGVIENAS